tara:strand:- start:107 stop:652 length:546 start_codon:yes stop_codon:yes gene_type:complete
MKFLSGTKFKECFLFNSEQFEDERGLFIESFRENLFNELVPGIKFVQENISFSRKNVLRGIHFQSKNAQAKLVRVIKGSVLDVFVDLRHNSKDFGKYDSKILSSTNFKQLYIPAGFGHGFLALEDTWLMYKCSEYYSPEHDKTIFWNDKSLKIDWGISNPVISNKDKEGISFDKYKMSPDY